MEFTTGQKLKVKDGVRLFVNDLYQHGFHVQEKLDTGTTYNGAVSSGELDSYRNVEVVKRLESGSFRVTCV